MIYYEMLMILNSDIPQTVSEAIHDGIHTIIKEKNGTMVTYDKWGKYLLAYKIKKNAYGIYVLVRFGINRDQINEVLKNLHNLCNLRFNNYIMRYVFVKIGKTISDVYCRPDSLEDAPRREKTYDIDEVIARKNKYTKKNKNFSGAYFANSHADASSFAKNNALSEGLNNENQEISQTL